MNDHHYEDISAIAEADLITADNWRMIGKRVAKIAEDRLVIEQAKGMIRAIYGVGPDTAFEILKWRSQESGVKLRRLAEQVTADFTAAAENVTHPQQRVYDNLLLTAHFRIERTAPVAENGRAG